VPGDAIDVCAAGEAIWQQCAHAGLGGAWRLDPGLAWSTWVPHRFLLAGVTLTARPALPAGLVQQQPGILCDSWAALEPGDLPGWTATPADPWMIRDPDPCTLEGPADVTIAPTRDASLFEATAFRANGVSAMPGELHSAGSEGFPGLTLFLAWRSGIPIGTALSVRHSVGVVVSAVSLVPEERRRGVGRALTAAAVLVAPGLPATLAASDLGRSAYRQLGFIELHRPVHWMPPRPATRP